MTAQDDAKEALETCPFCGKEAGMLKAHGVFQASCADSLNCKSYRTYETREEAAAAWNTRVQSAAQGDSVRQNSLDRTQASLQTADRTQTGQGGDYETITADMKGAAWGEFFVEVEQFDETGLISATPKKIPIPWTTCKDIYKSMIGTVPKRALTGQPVEGDARKAVDALESLFWRTQDGGWEYAEQDRFIGFLEAHYQTIRRALTPPKIEGLDEAIKLAESSKELFGARAYYNTETIDALLEAARQRQADEGE